MGEGVKRIRNFLNMGGGSEDGDFSHQGGVWQYIFEYNFKNLNKDTLSLIAKYWDGVVGGK